MNNHIEPSKTASWKELANIASSYQDFDLKSFANDKGRAAQYQLDLGDLRFNYARNLIDDKVLSLLFGLAKECRLQQGIEAMFSGQRINETEGRAVLHTALRSSAANGPVVDGVEVMQEIKEVLGKMESFSNALIQGKHKGYSGKSIRDVVNIGIGGSDLGPAMAYEALKEFGPGQIKAHYVSNVDGIHLHRCLQEVEPETTLFIVASKSFTTQETMANAHAARNWFLENGGSPDDIAKHFVALSTNLEAVKAFGIDENNAFGFWNWVGGRYSMWSAIGLSLCCSLGFDIFRQLLAGAEEVDLHFRNAPLEENIPVIMALLGIWYNNFLDMPAAAVLPYDQRLARFPAYLQQADMESNGKRTDKNGHPLPYHSGPIIWGEPGTNGQHAFYQLLHQGTRIIPCDFIAGAVSKHPLDEQQALLLANFLAQPQALMNGYSSEEVRQKMKNEGLDSGLIEKLLPHRLFPGNRPSNILFYQQLDPFTLGKLTALYEHKIFTQGWIWNINSFDQWGVELGKTIAKGVEHDMKESEQISTLDAVGQEILRCWNSWKAKNDA